MRALVFILRVEHIELTRLLTEGGGYPAGIYMYTTDSKFNQEIMSQYMATGKMITPPKDPRWGLGSLSNVFGLAGNVSDFRVIETTAGESLLAMLEADDS